MQPSGVRGAEFQCALPQHTEKFANCHWCLLALPRECIWTGWMWKPHALCRSHLVLCVKSCQFQRGRRAFFYYSWCDWTFAVFQGSLFFSARAGNAIDDHLRRWQRCCQAKQSNVVFYYLPRYMDWLMNIQSWSHCQILLTIFCLIIKSNCKFYYN
jgi:hypothetical protein